MTALWTRGMGRGSGLYYGNGYDYNNDNGDGYGDDGNGYGDGDVLDNGDSFGRGNGGGVGSDIGDGYPEQHYDGYTAIGRLLVYEATLPVADLLTLAVAR